MPWIIDGTTSRAPEGFVLDPDGLYGSPLDLGMTNGLLRLAGLTIPPAQKTPQWANNGDADGARLVRTPFYQNRECSMQIRVTASSKDDAVGAIGQLENKLQEADKASGGLPVFWTPGGATTGLTMYMLLGQITDMPTDDAYIVSKPLITVTFSCKPFLYGSETSVGPFSSSTPLLTFEAPSVAGDVAAEARLVLTDGSTQTRRYAEWGLEQYYYNHASPAPLLIDSASMVSTGFAGTALAHSGAYGGTTLATTLLSQPVAVCGTGGQAHVGSFRVKGRIYGASTSEYWRLTWQDGDGPFYANDYVQPIAGSAFSEVDFGVVDPSPAASGAQSWSGRIEAYTTTSGGETGELDLIKLYPCGEGYARLSSNYSYAPGVVTGYDGFVGTSGTALNGHAATSGGSWATSGATTDFTYTDLIGDGFISVKRATSSDSGPRFAILGSTSYTNTEVGVTCQIFTAGLAAFTDPLDSYAIVRWTDANNYARLFFDIFNSIIIFQTVVSGVANTIAFVDTPAVSPGTVFQLRAVVFASGRAVGSLLDTNGTVLATCQGVSSILATGGTLASGKPGFADQNARPSAPTRYYEGFYVGTPAAEQVVINSGRTLEVRSDSNLRQSSDGTKYGDVVGRGSRLFVPPAGSGSRISRVAVSATRNDLTAMNDSSVADGDTLTASLFWTPRFLAIPRS